MSMGDPPFAKLSTRIAGSLLCEPPAAHAHEPSWRILDPGIVRAERPDVAFGVATGVAPAAMVFILEVDHDARSRGNGLPVVRVCIGDDDVGTLGAHASRCSGRLDVLTILAFARGRAQH